MSLTRLAITRPVTILMLVLALVIMGLQSRGKLPVDLYPDIEFPMLFISTIYPGTGPEEMETLVSKPIEDAVGTISGLKNLSSTSSEGVSSVIMEFEIGTDIDVAASDARSKLDAIRNTLPEDAKAPVVNKLDFAAMPVVQLSISSDRRSSIEVRRIADDILKDRFSQIAGVATVGVSGGDVREIRVEVDKTRLEAYGVSIAQVVNALKMENLNLPSGTIKEERRNFAVRVMGEFTNPEQILNVRLASASNPNLTVRDVAAVRDTIAEATEYNRLDQGPSVTLTVQKQSDANTVKVVDQVRKELGKLTGKDFREGNIGREPKHGENAAASILPADVKVVISQDQSIFIKDALDDVYKSLGEGALLAVLIVFLFLHSLRGTFIVGLAIPVSMISTFIIMNAMGFSVNMMSMLGLSLSVGILVDDSIVVIENIHRHLRMGESPKEAAMKGRMEIGLAAMTITLVDVVVFVPIAFMGGIVGQFFRQFGIVIATATLFSLFVSFTLTPMLASRWLKSHEDEEKAEKEEDEHPHLFRRFTNAWEAGYNVVDNTYRRILAWALDHRPAVICMGLMVFVGSVATAMPKPSFALFIATLPFMGIVVLVLYLLWSLAARLQGWKRSLVSLVLLPVSMLIAVLLSNLPARIGVTAGPGGITLTFLTLMLTLGVIGYTLSQTADGKKAAQGTVFAPLAWLALGLFGLIMLVPTQFKFEFQPKVDRRQFQITLEHEVGTPLAVTDKTARAFEERLFNPKYFPEVKTVTTTVGSSGSGRMSAGASGADVAQMSIELKDNDDYFEEQKTSWLAKNVQGMLLQTGLMKSPMRSTDTVIAAINDDPAFSKRPGVKVTATSESGGPGGAPISIEVSGPDLTRTQAVAARIAKLVENTEGTYGTELSWRGGRPEVQAHIDRDRAAQYGISVAQVASALRTSLEGDTSTKYREGGKEYDIRVVLPDAQRDITDLLPTLLVGTGATGKPVYLYEVTTLNQAGGPTKVERTDRQRSVKVTSQLQAGVALGNVQQEINPKIQEIDTRGVTVKWSGQAEFMAESFTNMNNALLLSIVLVFMLMAALFESFLAPLIIMLSVPMAMAGAIMALTITHKSLSIVSMIGFIMLVGLVTKNAILMVDYTNTLRKEQGMDRRRALLEAGPTRLRPILMTTLAMIFGMMPTAIALSKGAEFRQPMAIAVIGGLLVALFLTLLMVPVFYEIMDNVGQRITNAKQALLEKAKV